MNESIFLNINTGVNDIKPNQNEGFRERNKTQVFKRQNFLLCLIEAPVVSYSENPG